MSVLLSLRLMAADFVYTSTRYVTLAGGTWALRKQNDCGSFWINRRIYSSTCNKGKQCDISASAEIKAKLQVMQVVSCDVTEMSKHIGTTIAVG